MDLSSVSAAALRAIVLGLPDLRPTPARHASCSLCSHLASVISRQCQPHQSQLAIHHQKCPHQTLSIYTLQSD